MILIQNPNLSAAYKIVDIFDPVDLFAITAEFLELLGVHFIKNTIYLLILILPVSHKEEF